MASSDDEDEKFLYGSEDEADGPRGQQKRKLIPQGTAQIQEPDTKRARGADDGDVDMLDDDDEEEDDDEDEDDEDSDSDVEIIIGTGADSSKLDSKALTTPSTAATATSAAESAIAPVSEQSAPVAAVQSGDSGAAMDKAVGALDINAVGEYEGTPITDIDPEVLKEKPWRQPGANLSDYFNYGFTEETWMEYLHKQEKLRKEYNPRKILMGLLALQQQGKLGDGGAGDGVMLSAGGMAHNDIKSPNKNNGSLPQPPAFPMGMPPMFGGFPPFPFPGMIPPNLGAASGNNGSGNHQNMGTSSGNGNNGK